MRSNLSVCVLRKKIFLHFANRTAGRRNYKLETEIDKLKLHPFFSIYGGVSGAGIKRIVCKLTGSYTINVGTKEPQTMKSLAEITHAWIEEEILIQIFLLNYNISINF